MPCAEFGGGATKVVYSKFEWYCLGHQDQYTQLRITQYLDWFVHVSCWLGHRDVVMPAAKPGTVMTL